MEEIGIPELTLEQVAELCERAERAARNYVLSQVPISRVVTFDVSVDAEGTKPVNVTVEIDLALSPKMKGFDADALVNEAVKQAHEASENYLRKLK